MVDNYSTEQSQKYTPVQQTRPKQEEFKQTATRTKSKLEQAIKQAKRMMDQDKFDENAQNGFIKLVEKESVSNALLDEPLWTAWIKIMKYLVLHNKNSNIVALYILTEIYKHHPDKLGDLTT